MAEDKVYLATTKTGRDIYIGDETLEHMKAHSDVSMDHIKEAIEKNDTYKSSFEFGSIDMGRIVGKDNCIEVKENDPEVHQLYRNGRKGTTPVTFSKEPKDTSVMTVGICLDNDDKHTLFTAFYGKSAPKEVWDPRLSNADRPAAAEFWKTHVIVVKPEDIDWERSDKKFMPKKERSLPSYQGETEVGEPTDSPEFM